MTEFKDEIAQITNCEDIFRQVHQLYTCSVGTCIAHYYSTNWVKVDGVKFKHDAVVVLATNEDEPDSPQFGRIAEIFLLSTKQVLLGLHMLEVIDYSHHYHSWKVKLTDNRHVVYYKELCSNQILHPRTSSSSFGIVKLITLKYALFLQ